MTITQAHRGASQYDFGNICTYRYFFILCEYLANKRDKDGNIASYVGLFEIGIAGTLYDIDGELVRYGFGLGNIDTYGSVTIIYNDRHDRIKAVADVMAFSYREVDGVWDETVRTMDYTITKRDSYGNWIERQCAYMGSTTNETRVITYYDTVPKPSKR